MKIFIMRHGTTVWNEKAITQGRTNNRLSKFGKQQTELAATKFKDVNFDAIFCSPLMRTVQTANIMNQFNNAKIFKDDRLIEIDQGIFTGKSKFNLSEKEKFQKSNRDSSCGMESYESVCLRAKDFLTDLQNKNFNNVLIITHNVTASLMEAILNNINIDYSNEQILRTFKNAEIKIFNI